MCTMATRLEFHAKLCSVFTILGKWLWDPFNFEVDDVPSAIEREAGNHVYFQPPETFKMVYPCIVYEMARDDLLHADDMAYRRKKAYTVTVIDKNPDSELPDVIGDVFNTPMNRHFTLDNLHHFVYTIFQ